MPHPESDPPLLSRIELLRLAHSLGVLDADVMTRAELRAAIDEARRFAPRRQEPATTWVSVARRLLASIVERGLNLPDTAALIRGGPKPAAPRPPPPVATVTLARIYAAQGHLERAIRTLEEVLATEPDHDLARELRDQLAARRDSLVQAGLYGSAAGTTPGAGEEEAEADSLEMAGADVEAPSYEPSEREPSLPAGAAAGATRLAPGAEPAPAGSETPSEAGELVAPAFGVVAHAAERALEAARRVGAALGTEGAPSPGPLSGSRSPDGAAAPSAAPAALEAAAPALTEPAPLGASVLEGDAAVAATEPAAAPAEPARPSARSDAPELETEPPATLATPLGSEPGGAEPEPCSPTEPAPEQTAPRADLPAASVPVEADASSSVAAPPVPAPALPPVPGLVMIETDSPSSYLYWELPPPQSPHWIVVVAHVATVGARPERRERRFPVQRTRGALRLEGLPRQAVVRASLMQDPAAGAVLAVAGAVRRAGETFEVRHRPHARCQPEDLARRAEPLLDGAARVYWD